MLNQIMLWQAMIVGWVRGHVSDKDELVPALLSMPCCSP